MLALPEEKFVVEEVEKFVMAEESSKATVQDSKSDTVNGLSLYKKNQRQPEQSPHPTKIKVASTKCSFCGQASHPSNTFQERKSSCPAFGHICGHCNNSNHFDHLCKSRKDKKKKAEKDKSERRKLKVRPPLTTPPSSCP